MVRLTALSAAVLLVAAAPVGATKITYVCGGDLCRIDPAKPRQVHRLTHDAVGYVSPSVSWNGARMAFFKRGSRLYRSDASARHRHALESRNVAPGEQALMSPEGTAVAAVETRETLSGGHYNVFTVEVQGLWLYPAGQDVASGVADTHTAGWLGSRLVVGRTPHEGDDQAICVLPSYPGDYSACGDIVAADAGYDLWWPSASHDERYVVATKVTPGEARRGSFDGRIGLFDARTGKLIRDLTYGQYDVDPVFSPDGSRVAFNRGRDLFVVRTDGTDLGAPRLLLHNAIHPAWSK